MKPHLSIRSLLILVSLIIGMMIAATLASTYSLGGFCVNIGGRSSTGGASLRHIRWANAG